MSFTDYLIPIIIISILFIGITRRVDIVDEFITGAKENLKTAVDILPNLILLMTAIGMFTSSGACEHICNFLSPITERLGFPKECLTLALIRPISGSGALSVLENILNTNPPESFTAKTACVLMGSTETTFYTITVYYGAIKAKVPKAVISASLFADFTGFVLSPLILRLLN